MTDWNDLSEEEKTKRLAASDAKWKPGRGARKVAPEDEDPFPIVKAPTGEEPDGPEDEGSGLDDLLSDEEIAEIYAQARLKVANERKAKRKKEIEAQALESERREAGLVAPATEYQKWLNQETEIEIRIMAARTPSGQEAPRDPIRLDGRIFQHGRREIVTNAQAKTLLDIMSRQHQDIAMVDGRPRTIYNEQLGRVMYQGGFMNGTGPRTASVR